MKIRGGALLARAFAEKGITHVFTLSGGFCNPALEGFADCGMTVINAPHEQVAGHLADGTTRITRKPAICLVGPEGFANAVPAMMEAWGERSPVIFVTGSSTLKRQGSGGFKEIDDVSIAAPLTKYSASVTDGSRIPEFVDRAYKISLSGYPGPVHLSVPVDIMFSSFEEDSQRDERPFVRKAESPPKAWPEPQRLQSILEEFEKSKKPMLIGGHGVWWGNAEKKLEEVGKTLKIPVYNIPYHQKLLPETSDAYMGLADIHQYPPSAKALEESDLVMMLGGRLDNQMNFGNPPLFPKNNRLICINGSPEELEQNRSADQILLSDPSAFLEALMDFGQSRTSKERDEWYSFQKILRQEWVESSLSDLEQEEPDELMMHPLRLAL
ncbi:MAG: hypothetical protein MK438_08920 [SAR324 cluster bacterium]|nr:hypothetical protein [SAR324 cluster bacterium]